MGGDALAEEKIQNKADLMKALLALRDTYGSDIKVLLLVRKDGAIVVSSSILQEYFEEESGIDANVKYPLKTALSDKVSAAGRPDYLG